MPFNQFPPFFGSGLMSMLSLVHRIVRHGSGIMSRKGATLDLWNIVTRRYFKTSGKYLAQRPMTTELTVVRAQCHYPQKYRYRLKLFGWTRSTHIGPLSRRWVDGVNQVCHFYRDRTVADDSLTTFTRQKGI
jgi:hypothetical protein